MQQREGGSDLQQKRKLLHIIRTMIQCNQWVLELPTLAILGPLFEKSEIRHCYQNNQIEIIRICTYSYTAFKILPMILQFECFFSISWFFYPGLSSIVIIYCCDKMQVHPDAPDNPLQDDLKMILDYERDQAHDFTRAGKLRNIHIADHNERILKNSLLQTQTICLPTFNNLRNERNINQLVEHVYQRLRPHIDLLNVCVLRSRTAAEGDYCFETYKRNFETQFKPTLKNILLDY